MRSAAGFQLVIMASKVLLKIASSELRTISARSASASACCQAIIVVTPLLSRPPQLVRRNESQSANAAPWGTLNFACMSSTAQPNEHVSIVPRPVLRNSGKQALKVGGKILERSNLCRHNFPGRRSKQQRAFTVRIAFQYR